MRIRLEPQVAIGLETCCVQVHGQEFSGFGYVKVDRENQGVVIYDFVPLDVGTSVYTEISAGAVAKLATEERAKDLRCWIHRHPLGSGKPGPENWSGTDNATIAQTPLGGVPELVGWSLSIVRTPHGWVGRVDNHRKGTTQHLEVVGQADPVLFQAIDSIYLAYQSRAWKEQPAVVLPPAKFKNAVTVRDSREMTLDEWEQLQVEQLSYLEDEELADEMTVFDFFEEARAVEYDIRRARSIQDFEYASQDLEFLENEIDDIFKNPPSTYANKLARLRELLETSEELMLMEEEV